jgi:dCMP deaminase
MMQSPFDFSDNPRKHLTLAWNLAHQSNDPNTENAAILVADTLHIATGVNHIPNKDIFDVAKMVRSEKLEQIIHAEEAAIISAARAGISTVGATLYALWAACPHCANVIIASGVKKVVGLHSLYVRTPERWRDKTNQGIGMMVDKGIVVDWYRGDLDTDNTLTFNGRQITA